MCFGPDLYATVKEMQQGSKMARLKVPAEGVIINEREFLVISAKCAASLDESDSYFELHIARLRKSITG
jgi:hypothetical protein